MSGNVVAILALNACFIGAGAGLLRALGGWRSARGLVSRIGLAYLAGVAAVGVLLQLLLVLGVPFGIPLVVAVVLAVAATGLLGRRAVDGPPGRLPPRSLLVPVALVGGMLALLAVDAVFQPLGSWDTWSQWAAKARSLVVFDGLEGDVFGSLAYREWNPDYPLLLPSVDASILAFSGGTGTRALALQSWLLLAGFVLAMVELLRDRVRSALLWPVLLVVAFAPSVQVNMASALADVPLGIFFGLAGVCAWRWLEEDERLWLALLALFSAATLATKVEGRIFVAALFVSTAAVLALHARRRLVPLAAAGAAALVGLVPWSLWARAQDATGVFETTASEAAGRLDSLGRVPLAVRELALAALDPSAWLVLVPVAAAAFVLAWRAGEHGGPAVALGTFGLCFAGLVLVYWVTPFDAADHLEHSAFRVVTAPVLFAAAVTPLLLSAALDGRPGDREGETSTLTP